jgi:hypothetical protein
VLGVHALTMPEISIVIPIHNEEHYLVNSINGLCDALEKADVDDYEIILPENGSTDRTQHIARELAENNSRIRLLTIEQADYGLALREGMIQAQGKYIVMYDLDYWDVSFLQKTVLLMKHFEYDVIIGSKNMLLSKDERHPLRRLISQGFRIFLFFFFKLKVSDTHGVKSFRNNETLKSLIAQTRFTRHIFDTELVIRCQREGLHIIELPMSVLEKRPSTTKTILKRVPEAIYDLTYLWLELKKKRNKPRITPSELIK